ncbi:hypothetical protein [Leptospira sp. GIMC2001]|uniref:hypothetical protein n=1 Tax=Leptospira sp. GIMC2001 TaxID=1513297 RepID=UPI00234B809F|nr:hypothetical protein [Leptospira sp. GIMC2001]WCL48684.1 hypothetical protein O4O04_15435 [Leptospira sp. GIMC2001]
MNVFSIMLKKKMRLLLLIGLIFTQYNCVQQDLVDRDEAYNEIYFALNYKSRECGREIPPLPLILLEDVSRRNLDLCTISITRTDCSEGDYPITCLLLYIEDDVQDIPWYFNFNDLSKRKISL